MTVATGNLVVPAAIFPYAGGTAAQNLASGMVLASGPLFGVVAEDSAAPNIEVTWNDGSVFATVDNDTLRFVTEAASATVSTFRGKMVRLIDASHEFTGLAMSVFALEAATVGKAGDGDVVTSEVVLFRTRAGQFILALATNVEVVAGQ